MIRRYEPKYVAACDMTHSTVSGSESLNLSSPDEYNDFQLHSIVTELVGRWQIGCPIILEVSVIAT